MTGMLSVFEEMSPFWYVVVSVIGLIAFIMVIFVLKNLKEMIVAIPEGHEVIIERFGRYSRHLRRGWHFIFPFIEKEKVVTWTRIEEQRQGNRSYNISRTYRISKIPIFEQLFDFPEYKVITNDLLSITVNGMLIYKIEDTKKAVYKISDLYLAFNKLVETSLRNTISKMDLVEVIRRKNVVEAKVIEDLGFINKNWGITITKFDIQEVIPPTQFVESNRRLEQQKRELRNQIERKENERKSRVIEEETKSTVQEMRLSRELSQATHQKELEKLKSESTFFEKKKDVEFVRAMLDSGINQKYLEVLEFTKAWKEVCKTNPNSTYIIPYDSAKFLGVGTIAQLDERRDKNLIE